MKGFPRRLWFLVPLWALLVGVVFYARPLMPIDETRYVAVAWDMWRTGDYLVPHLNGEIYSQKPPLLFWLINVAWGMFGVHEWAARLIGPLFGLFDLVLVTVLARALWPDDAATQTRAGAMLLAIPFFALYSTVVMFDTMLTFFVLLAFTGLVHAARNEPKWRAAAWIAIGIGGGLLSKGPIVLLYLLPLIAFAPWWSAQVRSEWGPFAARTAVGLVAGICIGLAWAIPAAMLGGPEYREAILWTQTAGRVTQSFAHERPITFYFTFIPLMVFPWAYWRPMRELFRGATWRDEGLRFCATWSAGAFVLLCLISGKQVHYLLPLVPSVALVAARTLSLQPTPVQRPVLVASVYALLGISALLAAMIPIKIARIDITPSIAAYLGIAVLVAGGVTFIDRPRRAGAVVWAAAAASVLVLTASHLFAAKGLHSVQDTTRMGRELAALQAAGKPVIHMGHYHGQFTFAGRLQQPIPVAHSDKELADWCTQNPEGYVIKYWSAKESRYTGETEIVVPFRGRLVGLVHADAPELIHEMARRSRGAPSEETIGP